ncbi:hypothetical protein [Nocardioides speluncae]|uniref:hypothetical protein n=1 Tax=Nocardioides speluncae TaxID=2670337 RepID=UPI000D689D85|nr:hypothetical protein [Nocardioides speluncae]
MGKVAGGVVDELPKFVVGQAERVQVAGLGEEPVGRPAVGVNVAQHRQQQSVGHHQPRPRQRQDAEQAGAHAQ